MSYLALALSSNALTGCSRAQKPGPGAYRESEPQILQPEASVAPQPGTSEAAAGSPGSSAGAPDATFALPTHLSEVRTPGEDHFGYCAAGLKRTEAKLDLLRLGAVCGPANGLLPYEPATHLVATPKGVRSSVVGMKFRQCVRVALATDHPDEKVQVTLTSVAQPKLSTRCDVHFGWCPPAGVFCGQSPLVNVDFSSKSGDVGAHVRIWTLLPGG